MTTCAPMMLPAVDPATGFHPTLNRMGGMSPVLDPYSQAFVEFAAQAPGPVLDVGAAYGNATIAALGTGARVVANDLDPRHLAVLKDRVPAAWLPRLATREGAFPDDLGFAPASLGAALLARVLHFLDGEALARGLAQLHGWLAPGGRVYGVAVTPHLRKLQPFMPTYAARVAQGLPWPGEVADVTAYDPEASLPRAMHFLAPDVVARALAEAGFTVEECTFFQRPAYVGEMRLDGRETMGFVASKPRR